MKLRTCLISMILLLNLTGIGCGADSSEGPGVTWIVEVVNKLPYSISAIIEVHSGREYPLDIIASGKMISERIMVYESDPEGASDGIREISIFTENDSSEEANLWTLLREQDLNDHVELREDSIFDFLEGTENLVKFRLEVIEELKGIGLPEDEIGKKISSEK